MKFEQIKFRNFSFSKIKNACILQHLEIWKFAYIFQKLKFSKNNCSNFISSKFQEKKCANFIIFEFFENSLIFFKNEKNLLIFFKTSKNKMRLFYNIQNFRKFAYILQQRKISKNNLLILWKVHEKTKWKKRFTRFFP